MARFRLSFGRSHRFGAWYLIVTLAACMGLAGCTALNQPALDFSRVEYLRDNPSFSEPIRSSSHDVSPFATTNKGLAIERSLGVE